MISMGQLVIYQTGQMPYPEVGHIIWIGPSSTLILNNRGVKEVPSGMIVRGFTSRGFRHPTLPPIGNTLDEVREFPARIKKWLTGSK